MAEAATGIFDPADRRRTLNEMKWIDGDGNRWRRRIWRTTGRWRSNFFGLVIQSIGESENYRENGVFPDFKERKC